MLNLYRNNIAFRVLIDFAGFLAFSLIVLEIAVFIKFGVLV